MDRERSTEVSCAEYIAALSLLHQPSQVIARPFENLDTSYQRQLSGYTLQFDEERDLAAALAFLAPRNDKPRDITALCIQEDLDKSCLNVLVAINKAMPNDGNGVLTLLSQDFGELFAMLAQVDGGLHIVADRIVDM